ncbi:MAG TPA: asparagine synthase (glutamine-hydrolyzing) [Planctomycetota bacterium]|nr:asparagine synthase (glutamine-hydrolyzing) [Planctomycetota bacterium]
MCGIVGLLKWDGIAPEDVSRVRAAADVLTHRGPDGAGLYHDSHIALGFRRLKIIDLSPAGDQPMSNEDGSLWVVFNGEIYNYRELREELKAQGHTFKSQSDTEVLLHGYETWGEDMLPKLRGMFAFAIWSVREQKLFLARDPIGVKPLYFAERSGSIAFASEPKALFALRIKPEIDPVAIHQALTYRYVPAPRSGFKDVEKLPSGNLAVAAKGTLQYRKWWRLPQRQDPEYRGDLGVRSEFSADETNPSRLESENWVQGTLPWVFSSAHERRLGADVPIGLWLSGGIDSGLIAAYSKKPRPKFRSFCAGFPTSEYDERSFAKIISESCQSRHTDFEIPADVFKLLPQIVWHADEPFFDSSSLPTFVLAEKTKPHATVVLSGDGGDEAFCGYDRYVGMQLLERYKKTPALFRKLALAYVNWRYPTPSRQGWDRMLRWLEKCRLTEERGHHPYLAAMELFSEEQKAALYGDAMSEETDGDEPREILEGAILRARNALKPEGSEELPNALAPGVLQRADYETYLPGDVLHKVDRMSMAHGVEVRSPFLDVDLISFALSLPDSLKLPGKQTKPLLRKLAEKTLPPEVVHARKKGFGVPLDDWFRGPLQKIALQLFEESHLVSDKLFKPRFWESFWNEHQSGKAQHGERLYALLSLELWYRTFISGPVPVTRPEPLR